MSEKSLLNELQATATKYGARLFRYNSGVTKIDNRYIRFGFVGAPDLVGLTSQGRFLAVEAKTKNTRITKEQRNFAKMVEDMGGIHVFAYSIDDLIKVLDNEKGNKDRGQQDTGVKDH